MAINNFIDLPEEEVKDNPEAIEEEIALHFDPQIDKESDEEEEVLIPPVTAVQALEYLRQLRLHEEQ
ncbi:hypothetical protein LTR66_001962 [Elasticomyces elasticus]|nr:hypothetical protein LTR66_001962 [Elasticomyces elasticus]